MAGEVLEKQDVNIGKINNPTNDLKELLGNGVNWEDGVNRVDVVNGVNAVEWDEVGELD